MNYCKDCEVSFANRYNLYRHISNIHGKNGEEGGEENSDTDSNEDANASDSEDDEMQSTTSQNDANSGSDDGDGDSTESEDESGDSTDSEDEGGLSEEFKEDVIQDLLDKAIEETEEETEEGDIRDVLDVFGNKLAYYLETGSTFRKTNLFNILKSWKKHLVRKLHMREGHAWSAAVKKAMYLFESLVEDRLDENMDTEEESNE